MTGGRGGAAFAALLAAAAVMQSAGGAAAQTAVPAPTVASSPAATPAPLPIPAAPVIVLPTPRASPTAAPRPTPRASAAPRATATSAARPSATASPRPGPTPPAPSATAPASPAAIAPSPAAASPTPLAAPPAPSTADETPIDHYWLAALAAVVLALVALVWVVLRRRRADPAEVETAYDEGWADGVTVEPDAAPPPVVGEPATPAPSYLDRPGTPPRARLTLAFRPVRAGLNLLSATSENEVTIVNEGDAPADDVRVGLRLVSAHGGLDAELTAIAGEPIGRSVVPPFTLAPDERRVVSAVGALPLEAVQRLTAAGRPMFVPVVAVTIDYRGGDDRHSVTQAFAIGVERVDSAKLAPFWLDVPARRYDQVAARPHGAVLER